MFVRVIHILLERFYGDRSDEAVAQIAYHFLQAKLPEKAVEYLILAGKRAERLFAYPEAVDFYSRSLSLISPVDHLARFNLLLSREYVYQLSCHRQAQIADISTLEILAQSLGPIQQAQASLRRASLAEQTWDFTLLYEATQNAIQFAQVAGQLGLEAEGWMLQGIHFWAKNNLQSSLNCWEKALLLARQSGSAWLEANILRYQGNYLLDHDIDKACLAMEESLRIFRILRDHYGEGKALASVALGFQAKGEYSRSVVHQEEARRICRETGNRNDEMWALHHLAIHYQFINRLDKIEDALYEAVEITRELDNPYLRGFPCNMLSILYWSRCQFDKAVYYAEQILDLAQDHRLDSFHDGIVYICLGIIVEEMGDLHRAETCFLRCIRDAEQSGSPFIHGPLAGMARLRLKQGKVSEARQYVESFLPYLKPKAVLDEDLLLLRSYLTAYQVMAAENEPQAEAILFEGHRLLLRFANLIQDEEMRRDYLNGWSWIRQIQVLVAETADLESAPLILTRQQ